MKKIIIISLLVVAVVAIVFACCPCRKGCPDMAMAHTVRLVVCRKATVSGV